MAQASLWPGRAAAESVTVFLDQGAFETTLRVEGVIMPEYSWYWSPSWQAWEKEADEDWEAGRYEAFESMDDFLDSLDAN